MVGSHFKPILAGGEVGEGWEGCGCVRANLGRVRSFGGGLAGVVRISTCFAYFPSIFKKNPKFFGS